MKSQIKAIKEHLEKGASLTAKDAFFLYQCFRLASRINDLRRQGMIISSKNNDKWQIYSYLLIGEIEMSFLIDLFREYKINRYKHKMVKAYESGDKGKAREYLNQFNSEINNRSARQMVRLGKRVKL